MNRSHTRGPLAEHISGQRRTAIIAAHPDDETIGLGARLSNFRNAAFITVSDGAPLDLIDARAAGFTSRVEYAAARAQELQRVLSLCEIAPRNIYLLGLTDQRVAFVMDTLARMLAQLFDDLESEIVITHPYEGGHPDHDATALAVHAACQILGRTRGVAPLIIEMTSYHRNGSKMEVERFLPCDGCTTTVFRLSELERRRKELLLSCYATQQPTLSVFPVEQEPFRFAPRYDFNRRPHAGPLFYDQFNWGLTSAQWQQLARAALAHLASSCQ